MIAEARRQKDLAQVSEKTKKAQAAAAEAEESNPEMTEQTK